MTHSQLLTSILTYISELAIIPEVFYPNIKNTTIPDDYLEVIILNARPDDIGLNNVTSNSGIIQINVNTKVDIGAIHSASIVDAVLTAFKRGTIIDTIRIDKTPFASQGLPVNGKYTVPITITYNYLTA